MWMLLVVIAAVACTPWVASAQTIYPLDRAEILAGARFDLKVEFPPGEMPPSDAAVSINGKPVAEVLGKAPVFVAGADLRSPSAMWVRDAVVRTPGQYRVEVRRGDVSKVVSWQVFGAPEAKARNVIVFIGDGLSNAHRVAARMLAKGIREGRYGGELAIDDMPHMALVSTAGSDSIITDSANSMSAYMTGHKTCVNAMGVYCASGRTEGDHPHVEPMGLLARRLGNKAIGIVTTVEVWDATPAAVVAHTRSRANRDGIVASMLAAAPEVVLGGGSAQFLPQPLGARRDGIDYLAKFGAAGYPIVATAGELVDRVAKPDTHRLLGLFHAGAMDGALDRRYLHKGSVARYPEQPDLVDQTEAALRVLERAPNGFFLMIEVRLDRPLRAHAGLGAVGL
ncbi:MAG: alkaline phosphatase [Hyphomicrobiaceae bacterium]